MKRLLFLLPLLLLFSCGKQGPLIPENYRNWAKLTEEKLNYYIPGHEEHCRIPYINPIGQAVTPTTDQQGRASYDYPQGTIVAKEIYEGLIAEPEDTPIALTVMIKDKTHPAQQEGWVWVRKDMATGKEVIFTGDMCLRCHAGANGKHSYGDKNPNREFRDYLFYPWK